MLAQLALAAIGLPVYAARDPAAYFMFTDDSGPVINILVQPTNLRRLAFVLRFLFFSIRGTAPGRDASSPFTYRSRRRSPPSNLDIMKISITSLIHVTHALVPFCSFERERDNV